jgi:hypothetical protein
LRKYSRSKRTITHSIPKRSDTTAITMCQSSHRKKPNIQVWDTKEYPHLKCRRSCAYKRFDDIFKRKKGNTRNSLNWSDQTAVTIWEPSYGNYQTCKVLLNSYLKCRSCAYTYLMKYSTRKRTITPSKKNCFNDMQIIVWW